MEQVAVKFDEVCGKPPIEDRSSLVDALEQLLTNELSIKKINRYIGQALGLKRSPKYKFGKIDLHNDNGSIRAVMILAGKVDDVQVMLHGSVPTPSTRKTFQICWRVRQLMKLKAKRERVSMIIQGDLYTKEE